MLPSFSCKTSTFCSAIEAHCLDGGICNGSPSKETVWSFPTVLVDLRHKILWSTLFGGAFLKQLLLFLGFTVNLWLKSFRNPGRKRFASFFVLIPASLISTVSRS